jgi:DNA-binding HxlR family transcriptional regulator
MTVETCNFKALLDVTASSKGNLSIQLKKLNDAGMLKIDKYFQKSYPTTDYSITEKGKTSFEDFFKQLQSLKNE